MATRAVGGPMYTPASFEMPLDVTGMIVNLSRDKKDSLRNHITGILSAHLGDALDRNVNRSSSAIAEWKENGEVKRGVVLTSLKEAYLRVPPLYGDHITNDFQSKYSQIARGRSFTYSLEQLREFHRWKTVAWTSTFHLDLMIQEALRKTAVADPNYLIGFGLDMVATQRQGQLMFAIFEKDGEREISRVLVSESML